MNPPEMSSMTIEPVARPRPEAFAVMALLATMAAGFCLLLWPEWTENPDLSHGFFAPGVFVLLVWESRRQGPLRWLPAKWLVTGGSVSALLVGFGCFACAGIFAASLAWNHALVCFFLAVSLGGFFLAGLLLLADERSRVVPFNWISLTAVFLWLLVTPIPNGTYARLTQSLQSGVTDAVIATLHVVGVPARQHGNVIELAHTTVGVEEACSGVRSLSACVFAGFFFAGWQLRRPLGRVVVIIAAPLLALGMNFIRSLTLTLLANSGHDISGWWHDATGYAILGVTAVILAGLASAFAPKAKPSVGREISRESSRPITRNPGSPGAPSRILWPFRIFWLVAGATFALGIFYFVNGRPSPQLNPNPPRLANLLPVHSPGWTVLTSADLYQFADILKTSHLLERSYLRPSDHGGFTQFTVYIAYWAPGQASVSRVASHTPDACWPGAGWVTQPVPRSREVPQMNGFDLAPAEHRLFKNNDNFPQNVWFWHVYDGHVINYRDPYSIPALFQLALQYGFRRQGEQYFIRFSSNKTWPELADEPLLREVVANLAPLGL